MDGFDCFAVSLEQHEDEDHFGRMSAVGLQPICEVRPEAVRLPAQPQRSLR